MLANLELGLHSGKMFVQYLALNKARAPLLYAASACIPKEQVGACRTCCCIIKTANIYGVSSESAPLSALQLDQYIPSLLSGILMTSPLTHT